jgi:predicted acetyltransferase
VTLEIRPVREDEVVPYIEALSTAFLDRPDVERVAREIWPLWEGTRTWAAVVDGRICGTFRSWPTELTVPGGARLPTAGVSAVTVIPTHRRRGILRAMVATEHETIREQGQVFGMLYAAEYPIYGRFGYGPACRESTWTLDTHRTRFYGPRAGTVELVTPSDDVRATLLGVFEAWRVRQVGEIRRREHMWDFELGLREEFWGPRWKGFICLHRDEAGSVDGYARYHPEEKWEQRQPRNTLVVDELHALTDAANADLWRFLAEVDWISSVKASRRSPSDRLPWLLTNARAAVLSEAGDGAWLRIFDVPRALESRRYERAGRIVLEVVDRELAGGRIRVALDAGPDGATCRPTDATPDLTFNVAALGAAYLGGTRLRDAVLAHGVDEHRNGALGDAGALLRTADEPWCSTFF